MLYRRRCWFFLHLMSGTQPMGHNTDIPYVRHMRGLHGQLMCRWYCASAKCADHCSESSNVCKYSTLMCASTGRHGCVVCNAILCQQSASCICHPDLCTEHTPYALIQGCKSPTYHSSVCLPCLYLGCLTADGHRTTPSVCGQLPCQDRVMAVRRWLFGWTS